MTKPTKSLQQILPVVALDQHNVEAWIAGRIGNRLRLRTKYRPTVRGKARQFTRENVFELALIGAVLRAGFPLGVAVTFANIMVTPRRPAEPIPDKIVLPGGKTDLSGPADHVSDELMKGWFAQSDVPVLIFIGVGEITRRVDKLFAEA